MRIQTFHPQLGDLYTTLAICGMAFLGLAFLAYRLGQNRHPDPRKRVLLPMLAYFVALLALMGALGAFWSLFKFPTLEVRGRQAIVLDGREYRFPRAGHVRLETSGDQRLLLLQTEDRRSWAFPEDRYALSELYGALRPGQ